MNDGRKLITELLKLTSGIEPDVLNCLLLLQSIGQASDLERPEEDAQTSDREESLWARVVQAASRPDSRILTTIADAVAQIKDKWFLPQNMIDRLCAAEADEYTLRELLYRLSKLSTDHDLLSWLFEENMARLEEIVQLLEKGDAKLADSLKLFEEGTKLVALCSGMLEEAEGKVVKLRKGSGGAPEETDFLDAPPEGPSGGM